MATDDRCGGEVDCLAQAFEDVILHERVNDLEGLHVQQSAKVSHQNPVWKMDFRGAVYGYLTGLSACRLSRWRPGGARRRGILKKIAGASLTDFAPSAGTGDELYHRRRRGRLAAFIA